MSEVSLITMVVGLQSRVVRAHGGSGVLLAHLAGTLHSSYNSWEIMKQGEVEHPHVGWL